MSHVDDVCPLCFNEFGGDPIEGMCEVCFDEKSSGGEIFDKALRRPNETPEEATERLTANLERERNDSDLYAAKYF